MTEQKTGDETAGARAPAAGVSVGADEIIAAATALAWAARWDVAARMLASARADEPDDVTSRRLALAGAALAVHHDFRAAGPRWAPDAMARAEAAAEPVPDVISDPAPEAPEAAEGLARWRLGLLRLQYDYEIALTGADGTPRFGPEGHDPARLAALAQRAEQLSAAIPDLAGAGWAAFYRGLIADNLIGDRAGAPRWFTRALDAAGRAGDDYLAGEALRHLGDHDEEAGDLSRARARWERSAELWAGIGNITGVLAQQLLLAQLAFREANAAAGTAIAAEVSRWAGAAGLVLYQRSADELIERRAPGH
jgi:tetratricopeptide (TPR) repeat protein